MSRPHSYLDVPELCIAGQASKQLQSLACSNPVWKALALRRWRGVHNEEALKRNVRTCAMLLPLLSPPSPTLSPSCPSPSFMPTLSSSLPTLTRSYLPNFSYFPNPLRTPAVTPNSLPASRSSFPTVSRSPDSFFVSLPLRVLMCCACLSVHGSPTVLVRNRLFKGHKQKEAAGSRRCYGSRSSGWQRKTRRGNTLLWQSWLN